MFERIGVMSQLREKLANLGERERVLEPDVFFSPLVTIRDHAHFGQLVHRLAAYHKLLISTADERDWTALPLIQSELEGFRAEIEREASHAKPTVKEHFRVLLQEVGELIQRAGRI
ncbi:MAG: hypothetical protein HYT16_04075 [DPANN group archaeon]|nr:hypothetical protein [DPANN group archaeon]